MKKLLSMALLTAAILSTLTVGAQAADYEFVTDGTPEYYGSTSYEEVYGSQYNYGGPNVVDSQIPELEYGSFSTTQTGIMEKTRLPGCRNIATRRLPRAAAMASPATAPCLVSPRSCPARPAPRLERSCRNCPALPNSPS